MRDAARAVALVLALVGPEVRPASAADSDALRTAIVVLRLLDVLAGLVPGKPAGIRCRDDAPAEADRGARGGRNPGQEGSALGAGARSVVIDGQGGRPCGAP